MAKSMIDPNEKIHSEDLRDSLEDNVEEFDRFSFLTIQTNHTQFHEPTTEHDSSVSLPNDHAKVSSMIQKQQKPSANVQKLVTKPKVKNIVEWNKMNITKGRTKNSYSNLHKKKVGKSNLMEEMEKEVVVSDETNNPSKAAIEFHKQLVVDGILTEKNELSNFDNYENMSLYFRKPVEETSQLFGLYTSEIDKHRLKSNTLHFDKQCFLEPSSHIYPREINLNDSFKYMHQKTNGASHFHGAVSPASQLPPLRTLSTSVQSAPGDMQSYQGPCYEKSYRSSSLNALKSSETFADLENSMMSLTSSKFASDQGDSMTYSSICTNAKQNERTKYKPYTLGDYKRLKNESKPGGLGPDTNSEEHQQKAKKAIRQKEYSFAVKQRNTAVSKNHHGKKKPTSTITGNSVQKQEANARRVKALEYAKAIPKPVTSKHQNVWRSPRKAAQEPQTLVEILQQRHENEKKAVDAMKKDLQAKLRTK